MNVNQVICNYIDYRSNILSPSTIREYRYALKRSFQEIGLLELSDINNDLIQRWINHLSLTCSPKTVTNVWSLLHTAINAYAPDIHLHVHLPQPRRIRIIIPNDVCVTQLIHECHSSDMRTAVILASCMGLRRSEICALCWSDYFNKTHLKISKATVMNDDLKLVVKQPKTLSSDRILEIPGNVSFYLYQLHQIRKPRPSDLIVPMAPNDISYRFSALRKKVGITCRFHDLRHYYASVLLALEIPDLYAMELMGHSTPTMLKRVYQHTMDYKMQESTHKVNSYFMEKISFE